MFAETSRAIRRGAVGAALSIIFLSFLFVPGLVLAQPPPAPPAATPGAGYGGPVADIKAAERLRFDAMVKGDTEVLTRLLGEDLTYKHSTGVVDTKARLLESISSGKLRYLALTPSDAEARLVGEAKAEITGRIEIKVVSDGKELSFPAKYTSTYARRHGRWLLVAWESTPIPQP